MELSNWTIFSLLDKEFAAQIRLACVFGTHLAIMIKCYIVSDPDKSITKKLLWYQLQLKKMLCTGYRLGKCFRN
jgi:hypothetical protein